MVEWTSDEIVLLKEMANEDKPWSEVVQAYLDALEEVGELQQ